LIDSLRQALCDAVSKSISEVPRVAVAFSGGVDSSLLAKICTGYLKKQVTLVTIGFSGSHDIIFSRTIAAKMGMDKDYRVYEIDYCDFEENLRRIREAIRCNNTSHIENCIAYFYICRVAKDNDVNMVLSANGCDELFCGYDKYRRTYDEGEAAMNRLMDRTLSNEFALIEEIKTVACQLGVQVRQPFLSQSFIEFARTIPTDQKIHGRGDRIRKHILRQTALDLGVPDESAMKPKKALQYGSSIHKCFKQIERKSREEALLQG
jgi:asparagine synthase (glutamine-hydrolysing)